MKLISTHITEFKSIRDSNSFEIGDITCLVGKNEAGKTAILQALYRLNPVIQEHGNYDVTDDYPRSDVEDYRQDVESGRRKSAIVVKAKFLLSDDEIKAIEEDYGEGILKGTHFTLSKGYDNVKHVGLEINEKVVVENVIEDAQLPADLANKLAKAKNIIELNETLKAITIEENKEHVDRLRSILKSYTGDKTLVMSIYEKYLEHSVPKFMYFDEYFMMKGYENIESLKERVNGGHQASSDYPLMGLLDLARLNLDELVNHQRTEELVNKLEGAGNHLSRKVLKYWSQNKHISMKFDVRPARGGDPEGMKKGTNIWARVHDAKREVSTLLGTRSRGFVWFFSFLAWFDQQERKKEPLIILLDEPGLFLHGRAQGDLLDYIEKELKGHHQVIYTTHSPFMVDPSKFDRVRIVQDKSMENDGDIPKEQDGTKIITEVFEATPDSLFPLQGALGYDIFQTLFVGPNCLVVEGVSDLLYLQSISTLLDKLGRESLDERWTITPVGGSEKVPTFVALLGAQKGLKVATLIDIQIKDKQSIENLYKRKLLKKQNVLTFAEFTGAEEADIEDMFDNEFYLKLLNNEYSKELSSPISLESLPHNSPRILQCIDSFLEINPLKNGRSFSHFRPARHFSERLHELDDISPETLERFEKAFKTLNSLL